jgi:hypothetical protein
LFFSRVRPGVPFGKILLQFFPRFCQVPSGSAFGYSKVGRDLFMRICLKEMHIQYGFGGLGQAPDSLKKNFRVQVGYNGHFLRYISDIFQVNDPEGLSVQAADIINGRMGNHGFDPGFHRSQAGVVLMDFVEHFQKAIIKDRHRFHVVLAITLTYPVDNRIEMFVEQFLRFSIVPPAPLYPFIYLTRVQSFDDYFDV